MKGTRLLRRAALRAVPLLTVPLLTVPLLIVPLLIVPLLIVAALTVVAAPAAAQGKSGTAMAPGAAAIESHAPPGYVIGPLDVLEVRFWRETDLSAEVVVRPDGRITLPLLNEIDAGGLTPEQLRLDVVDRARRFVEDPSAIVTVKQINSRNVFVVGEVAKPGMYPLGGPTSVLQMIATAGGFNEFAATDRIVVVRATGAGPVRYRFDYKGFVKGDDPDQNIELRSGDTVVVP